MEHVSLTEAQLLGMISDLADSIKDQAKRTGQAVGATWANAYMGDVVKEAQEIVTLVNHHWAYRVDVSVPPCPCGRVRRTDGA